MFSSKGTVERTEIKDRRLNKKGLTIFFSLHQGKGYHIVQKFLMMIYMK